MRCLPQITRLLAFIVFGMVWASTAVKAQDVDWVTNINDTGSDPTPAGGLITYQVTVTNNGFDAAPANTLAADRARRNHA
jgi:ABC-type molybdate transport system substrate-binding protein